MAKHIYWSQHAPIERRPMELVGSGTDRELTEIGIRRAHQIGSGMLHLIEAGVIKNASGTIFSSPLKRAVATAEIVGHTLGFDIVVREELRAQHFGVLEGKTKEEIERDEGLARHLHSNLPPERLFYDEAPGGESVKSTYERMSVIRNELFYETLGNPIVITHGSVLKTLVGSVCERPLEEWGSITREFKGRIIEDQKLTLQSLDYPQS
ncbi:MAG TPA: histidine phosphatase family protein [Candidatus Saccharimonadales bacterium]|nr:histidine phosphatase family protein [Candidatus Saccharimonadales bacterium]